MPQINHLNTRFPNGVTNVEDTHPLAAMGQLSPIKYITIFDDFINPASATASDVQAWTATNDSATGTPVFNADAVGGVASVLTAAADNDYSAYASANEIFKFTAGKKLWLEARVKVAEATVLESTWWVGLTDTLTTGGVQANAAGPLASYDGALFWKTPETAMTLNFETSNAGTQNTLSAFATTTTGTWTKVAFYFDGESTIYPYAATYVSATDTETWKGYTGQTITTTGLEEMHVVFGIKAGPTGAAETLQIDYIFVAQER
jgi:hypothetical protein